MKYLRDKETALVKVVWGGAVGGSVMWELVSQVKELCPELFPSGNFRGKKFFK